MMVYALPAFIAALLTAFIGLYSFLKVQDKLIWRFSLLAASLTIWSLGSALELFSTHFYGQIFWAKFQHLGADFSALFWLALVLAYLGHERYLSRAFFMVLSIVPGLTLILVFSNSLHGLIWQDISFLNSPFPRSEFFHGLWFKFVLLPYNYGLILLGIYLLSTALLSSHASYKAQIFALMSAAIIPLLANAIYLLDLFSQLLIDLTPIGFAFSAVIIMKAFWGDKLFKVIPIFQHELFNASEDAIFLLDKSFRILDANSVAKEITASPLSFAKGESIFSYFNYLPFQNIDTQSLGHDISKVMNYRVDENFYDLSLIPIRRGQRQKAYVFTMRDASRQHQDALRLRQLSAFQQALLELMHDLLPARSNLSFFQKVLDYAIELIPGAQAGSVLLQSPDKRFRYIALAGFNEQLKTVSFSESELELVYGLNQGKQVVLLENLDALNAENLDDARRQVLLDVGESQNIKVSMVMPIYLGQELKAIFALDNKESRAAFDTESKYMGAAFANQVAAVLEKTFLEQKDYETAQLNKLLAYIESLLLKNESLSKLLPQLVESLGESSWLALGSLRLYQLLPKQGLKTNYSWSKAYSSELLEPQLKLLREQSLAENRLIYLADFEQSEQQDKLPYSLMVCPIQVADSLWGCLEVVSPCHFAFAQEKLEFFSKLCKSLDLALSKQQDREHLEQLANFRQSLIQLTDYILKEEKEADFYQAILERASSIIPGVEAASLLLKDAAGEFYFAAGIGYDNSKLAFIRLDAKSCDHASKLSCLHDFQEPRLEAHFPFNRYLAGNGIKQDLRYSLSVPIRVQGKVSAVLVLHHYSYEQGFGLLAREMAEMFGAQLSTAVQSVQLRKASQKAAYVQSLLAKLERLLLEQTQLQDFFPKLAKALIEAEMPSLCQVIVFRYDKADDRLDMQVHHQDEAQGRALEAFLQERGFLEGENKHKTLWRVIREKKSQYIKDVSLEKDWLFFEENPVRSVLTCPLVLKSEVWGMVEFASHNAYAFEGEDKQFLEHISKSIELALLRQTEQEEREQLYASVLEREQKLSLLAENSSDIIALHALNGSFLYISPAAERLLGFSHEDLMAMLPRSLYHPEDADMAEKMIYRQLLKEGKPQRYSYRIRKKDDSYLWLETVTQLIKTQEGMAISSSSRDVTEQKRMEAALRHNALYDALTGLPNRTLLLDRLDHVLKRSWRTEETFALLFLDLNRFKMINDSLGHHIGDELLKTVAKRLELSLRPSDTVARLGGDEFCLLLENLSSQEELITIIERLHSLLASPLELDGKDIFSSSSIGAVMNQRHYERAEDMLRDADTAMYRAKFKQQTYALFDASMHQEVVHKLGLENDLRQAIDKGELFLMFQPILDLAETKLVGLEALIRWKHPSKGLISPEQFIPLAEENGFICQIDNWVLERACKELSQWQQSSQSQLSLGINIAAKSFEQAQFAEQVLGILKKTGIAGSSLKLELTERTLMQDDVAKDALNTLREQGVQIQIDDFGTGYSSLNYLHTLPIDSIKIDRSFVSILEKDTAIVKTILALAKQLNLKTIAEGIETPEQWALLQNLGCELGQGYLFSAPKQLNELFETSYDLKAALASSHKDVRVSMLP